MYALVIVDGSDEWLGRRAKGVQRRTIETVEMIDLKDPRRQRMGA